MLYNDFVIYSRNIQTTFIEQEEAVEETKLVSPTPDITMDHNYPKPAPKTEPLSTHEHEIENINTKIIEDKNYKTNMENKERENLSHDNTFEVLQQQVQENVIK
jgi:hypothetical protein